MTERSHTSSETDMFQGKESPARLLDLSLIEEGRVVIVGLGGIGSFLSRLVTMFLSSGTAITARVILIDGDSFEERNRERMEVPDFGNKADVVCSTLTALLGRPGLYIRPVSDYVTAENVDEIIHERDVVFSCVDNHATRRLLSDRCERLGNVVLISGGNDGVEDGKFGTYGNIQVYVRRDGLDLNPSLTRFHPEILNPADEVPGPSCEDLAASTAPQVVFTNFFAAAVMGSAFYRLLRVAGDRATDERDDSPRGDGVRGEASPEGGGMYDEACFDIFEARLVPHSFGGTGNG